MATQAMSALLRMQRDGVVVFGTIYNRSGE
jgi:hypothetical protein